MSPVEACRDCGGLFAFLPRGICADCLDLRESHYQQVREWLLENAGASIPQASEATGVMQALIMEFVQDGRLEFTRDSEPLSPAEEEVRERIRRDLAAREAATIAADGPAGARPARLGMRSRGS